MAAACNVAPRDSEPRGFMRRLQWLDGSSRCKPTIRHDPVIQGSAEHVSGGEEESVFPEDRSMRMLAIHSLLMRLKDQHVRSEWAKGTATFLLVGCTVQLEELDALCAALLLVWTTKEECKKSLITIHDNLQKLIDQTSDLFHLKCLGSAYSPKTFAQWFAFLSRVACSSCWTRERPANKVTSIPFEQLSDSVTVSSLAMNGTSTASLVSPTLACINRVDSVPRPVNPDQTEDPAEHGSSKWQPGSPKGVLLAVSQVPVLKQAGETLLDRGNNEVECGGGGQRHTFKFPVPKVFSLQRFTPTCSVCTGSHLGMNCQRLRTRLQCHWCGRVGHSEEQCWRRSGACLICGSANHRLRQCPRYVPFQTPVFPPWCSLCDSNHLGQDCNSPSME